MNNKIAKKITFSAVMIALSTVLSLIKLFDLPLGGSITPLSMLPVCLISIVFGIKFAIIPCMLYGVIQMMIGGIFGWGLTPEILIASIALDYVVAFGVLCFAGIFRKKGFIGNIVGIFFASALRFISHFVSGFILWTNMDQFTLFGNTFANKPVLYSLCYNGLYMLPEAVLTCIGAIIIFKIPVFDKLLKDNSI